MGGKDRQKATHDKLPKVLALLQDNLAARLPGRNLLLVQVAAARFSDPIGAAGAAASVGRLEIMVRVAFGDAVQQPAIAVRLAEGFVELRVAEECRYGKEERERQQPKSRSPGLSGLLPTRLPLKKGGGEKDHAQGDDGQVRPTPDERT